MAKKKVSLSYTYKKDAVFHDAPFIHEALKQENYWTSKITHYDDGTQSIVMEIHFDPKPIAEKLYPET